MEAYGGSPVQLAPAEIYEAVQRGTIEGIVYPWGPAKSRMFYEVVDYVIENVSPGSALMLIANREFFNSLPEDLQAILEVAGERYLRHWVAAWLASGSDSKKTFREAGVEIYSPSPAFGEKLKPLQEEWLSEMEGKGHKARELMDKYNKYLDFYGF